MLEVSKDDDEEGGSIFEGIGEMRKHFPGVFVPPDALGEPKPGRETRHHRVDYAGGGRALRQPVWT